MHKFEFELDDYYDNEVTVTVELEDDEYYNFLYEAMSEYFEVDEEVIKNMESMYLFSLDDIEDFLERRAPKLLNEKIKDKAEDDFRKSPDYKTEESELKYLEDMFEDVDEEYIKKYETDYARYQELLKKA